MLDNNHKKQYTKNIFLFIPILWFILFLIIPLILILMISIQLPECGKIISFKTIINYSKNTIDIVISFNNYIKVLCSKLTYIALITSIKIAFITTILCIFIGYPMAFAISQMQFQKQQILLILIIIPYWSSFLLRTYAWITILGNSYINKLLIKCGLSSLALLYNNFSMYLGMLYCYLPFFILPLCATLIKIDSKLYDAAYDLGAKSLQIFFKITIPLSMVGLINSSLIVFVSAIGETVIPQILGGMKNITIGNLIWEQFFIANNWGISAANSIILIIILIFPIICIQKMQKHKSYNRQNL